MRNIGFIALVSLFASCNDIDFRVTNNTDTVIDSVILSNGFDEAAVYGIRPNKSTEGHLNFSGAVTTDGNYRVKVILWIH